MDASVEWKRGLTFVGKTDSGFTLQLGSAGENGEEKEGPSPVEAVLVALASCTGMDVISILHKKRQNVTHFEVKAHGDRSTEHPKKFIQIQLEYVISGQNIDPAAAQRAVELSNTKYCSVRAMLANAVEIEDKITLLEG